MGSFRQLARPLGVVVASVAVLLVLASPSGATLSSISGSMEGATKASPGDWISAGYSFTMPGSHPAADVSMVGGSVRVHYQCATDNAITGDIAIALADATLSVASNDGRWYPSDKQQVAAVYQGAAMAPDVCGGGQLDLRAGATFTIDVHSSDTTDKVNVRFHYVDAATKGAHANLNCSSPIDNPDPGGVNACSSSWSGTKSVIPDAGGPPPVL
jgi:hypothetical protein